MSEDDVKLLETYAIIGFDGSAVRALKCHPDGKHIVYPMGNKVCIQNWQTKHMHFLSGHSNIVSTVAVSPGGKYIGSGQVNHIGFKALCILWDFEKRVIIAKHELHKVRVEALVFTCDDGYMISMGGRDDGCIVVWDCAKGAACATATAAKQTAGDALTITSLWGRNNCFITGGDGNLRVWNVKKETKSLLSVDVTVGKIRRCIKCISINKNDGFAYAGTTTGDLFKFTIGFPPDKTFDSAACNPTLLGCYGKCGVWKRGEKRPETVCYSQGVQCIMIMDDDCLIVGAGDGTIDLLDEINWTGTFDKGNLMEPTFPNFKALRSVKLDGSITSLELMESPDIPKNKRVLLVGTKTSEIYSIAIDTFKPTLVVTCHRCAINDIVFPKSMSGVFATGGTGDIRVWCLETCQELLRIAVPNFICSTVLFTADGKAILSAWNDGCIRAFTPLTGRLIYSILNTHNKGTSALAVTSDGKTLISGGCEGQVRVWDLKPTVQTLKKVLKEHKSPVSAINVNPNDTEAVSAGTDGSCIIWDLIALSRRQVMYANTLFMCVAYEPTGCQLLTGGSDRRIAYWEVGTGNLARELEATKTGAINGLHISLDGKLFVSAGNDQIVKLWQYQAGIYTHLGIGHSGAVSCCRFSPDGRYIVSACAAGSIIVWKVPEQYLPNADSKPTETSIPPLNKGDTQSTINTTSAKKENKTPPIERLRLPAAPSKDEQIKAMDTSRSSVHTCCPCPDSAKSKTSSKASGKASSGSCASRSQSVTATVKKHNVCVPPDYLPTRTTSKASISSNRGNGYKKR